MTPRPTERARFGKSGRGFQRADRVQEQLREVIAAEIERRADSLLEKVTITGVDSSPDVRSATIFFTVYGDEQTVRAATAKLETMTGLLRKHVANTVRLRFAPTLTFAYDETIERGLRMERLLNDIQDTPRPDDGSHEAFVEPEPDPDPAAESEPE